MPAPTDVSVKMISPRWRGIEFWCGPWSFGFKQDQAQHKYIDRDGGIVEATGRDLATYTFEAIFRNGIVGPTPDSKNTLPLFPDTWQKFAAACADRTTGTLTHPALGPISVKCQSFDTKYDPSIRDGVMVDVSFIESPKAEEELTALLGASSPIGDAQSAAGDLDTLLGEMNPAPELPDSVSPSLLDSLKQITGGIAAFKLGLKNVAGLIDSYVAALGDLEDQLHSLQDPKQTAAPLLALGRLRDALFQAAGLATPKSRQVLQVTLKADARLDALPAQFGMSLDDFLGINPTLATKTVVKRGTRVFVYVKAAAGGVAR